MNESNIAEEGASAQAHSPQTFTFIATVHPLKGASVRYKAEADGRVLTESDHPCRHMGEALDGIIKQAGKLKAEFIEFLKAVDRGSRDWRKTDEKNGTQ